MNAVLLAGFFNTIDKFQLERPPEFQYKDWKVISPGEDHTLAIDCEGKTYMFRINCADNLLLRDEKILMQERSKSDL